MSLFIVLHICPKLGQHKSTPSNQEFRPKSLPHNEFTLFRFDVTLTEVLSKFKRTSAWFTDEVNCLG